MNGMGGVKKKTVVNSHSNKVVNIPSTKMMKKIFAGAIFSMSFRGDAKHRTRNLEIPRCAIAHLGSGPSDHPGMTESVVSRRIAPQGPVILGESGVSSTPQLCDSITGASEYWIARFCGR